MDRTMAFYYHLSLQTDRFLVHPSCGRLKNHMVIYLSAICSSEIKMDFLCEMDSETYPNTSSMDRPSETLSSPGNQTLLLPHVTCPSGHMTLDFLVCDGQSACWSDAVTLDGDRWGLPTSASCPAPLASLPPYFECGSGDVVVSFSLACNHRTDCLDFSDENFCGYPPCDAKSELQCLPSRQVTSFCFCCCYSFLRQCRVSDLRWKRSFLKNVIYLVTPPSDFSWYSMDHDYILFPVGDFFFLKQYLICVYVCMHTRVYKHARMRTCICKHVCVRVCMYFICLIINCYYECLLASDKRIFFIP